MIHVIHATLMFLMYILLYFNTNLYDLLLSDVSSFSKFILILILICFVEICYFDDNITFLLYFFYYIIFIIISLFSIPNRSTWSLPFHIFLYLINTNILINLKLNTISKENEISGNNKKM